MKFWEIKCWMGIHKWEYYTINLPSNPKYVERCQYKRRMCKCCFKIQWYIASVHPESSGYRDLSERNFTEEEKRDIKLRKLDI
jgi:hypothetical protein